VTKIHTLGDQGSSSINEPAQTARGKKEQKQTVKPPQSKTCKKQTEQQQKKKHKRRNHTTLSQHHTQVPDHNTNTEALSRYNIKTEHNT